MRANSQRRSMRMLVLGGFAIVSLPLIFVTAIAVLYLDRLAQNSERLLIHGIQVSRLSDTLAGNLDKFELCARQYSASRDNALIPICQENHDDFVLGVEQLRTQPSLKEKGDWELEGMRQQADQILYDLLRAGSVAEMDGIWVRFRSLHGKVLKIASDGNRFIDHEQGALRRTARDAQRFLVFPALILIPVAIVLVLLFTTLILTPVRELAAAIGRLGVGDFRQPVEIGGPPELSALGQNLDWLRRRLATTEQEKNAFLRRMSHELKTPLASIREGTELMMDGTVGVLNQTQREVAGILQASGLELQYLIENLLDFSEWHEKKVQLNLQNFELQPLVKFVLKRHHLAATNKLLKVNADLEDIELLADRIRIRMSVDNLVSNAVKFAPAGGEVYIRTRRQDDNVVIDVADNGPGIPVEERQKVFEAFYQGSTMQSGHVRGTGIGLSVVAECVRAHGGSVEIVDDGGYTGAHFRIRLPVGKTPGKQVTPAPGEQGATDGQRQDLAG
jgi:two-component system sensor histidine kinase GlrK